MDGWDRMELGHSLVLRKAFSEIIVYSIGQPGFLPIFHA